MRVLLVALLLAGCTTTITIKPNGEVSVKGPRQATIITDNVAVSTSKMLMDDTTITALGVAGLKAVTEVPK